MNNKRDKTSRRTLAARATAAVLAAGILAGCSAGISTTTSAGTGNGQTATAQNTTPQTTEPGVTTPGTDSATSGSSQTQPGETENLIFAKAARQLVLDRLGEGFIRAIEYDHDGPGPHYKGEALMQGKKIQFVLNAETGQFDRWEERDSDDHSEYAPQLADIITMDEAADLVIDRSGQANTFVQDIELSSDLNDLEYEGDAYNNGVKYEFEIDALTGEFKEWEEENSSDWETRYSNLQ